MNAHCLADIRHRSIRCLWSEWIHVLIALGWVKCHLPCHDKFPLWSQHFFLTFLHMCFALLTKLAFFINVFDRAFWLLVKNSLLCYLCALTPWPACLHRHQARNSRYSSCMHLLTVTWILSSPLSFHALCELSSQYHFSISLLGKCSLMLQDSTGLWTLWSFPRWINSFRYSLVFFLLFYRVLLFFNTVVLCLCTYLPCGAVR